uniref:CW domain-containing protein n=1 Tax=Haemonchus contortus TaxID=6289 RepID=A0A7I4XV99_HAECO
MFSTITFVVLFLSQICSYSTSNAAFVLDNDFHSGPVQIGGIEIMDYDTVANGDISACFTGCVQKSDCVIATLSEDECRMYRASDQETNLTSIYVGNVYHFEENAQRVSFENRGCGSVKLLTQFCELSGSGIFSPNDVPHSIARSEGHDSNPQRKDTPDAKDPWRMDEGIQGNVPSPMTPPAQFDFLSDGMPRSPNDMPCGMWCRLLSG